MTSDVRIAQGPYELPSTSELQLTNVQGERIEELRNLAEQRKNMGDEMYGVSEIIQGIYCEAAGIVWLPEEDRRTIEEYAPKNTAVASVHTDPRWLEVMAADEGIASMLPVWEEYFTLVFRYFQSSDGKSFDGILLGYHGERAVVLLRAISGFGGRAAPAISAMRNIVGERRILDNAANEVASYMWGLSVGYGAGLLLLLSVTVGFLWAALCLFGGPLAGIVIASLYESARQRARKKAVQERNPVWWEFIRV